MIKTLLSSLAAVMLFCFLQTPATVHAQQVFRTTSTNVIGFLEYLPANYHTNSDKYPVVIFLHGIGERGTNTTDPAVLQQSITSVTKLGPPKHVKDGTQFPFILISPQLKNNYSTWPSWYVMEVLNYVKTYLRIDERRIHITGLSLGGGGVWVAAQDNPTVFASASPVCGGYNSPSKACGIAAENLPVWAFHGDADTVVPISKSVNMVNAINACTPAPNPLAKLTVYPGVAHNAWDRAYAPNHTYHNPNVYEWLMGYTNTVNAGNKIPVASAGSDKTIYGSSTTVTCSATDADGTITSYRWKQLEGATVTMTNASTKTLSIASMTTGKYMFRVTVTDNNGNTDSDYIRLTVDLTNKVPVVNAGADVDLAQPSPTQNVTITGSASDADGTIASYAWKVVSGPVTPSLANTQTPTVTVSGLTTSGVYELSLTAKDDKGATATDKVSIIVNAAPVANAGADKSIELPTSTITLSGSGTDADGTVTSYLWSLSKGPAVPLLTNAGTKTVSISGLTVPGQYVFKLRVEDNDGVSDYDHVSIFVIAAGTSSASMENQTEVMGEEGSTLDLAIADDGVWEHRTVSVYDDAGRRVFSGKWSAAKFDEVFSKRGLYIYKVAGAGERPITRKIVIGR
jgi:hypothetical protein